jgi:RES domain-containing protein
VTLVVFRIGTNKATTLDSLPFGSALESGRWHRKPSDGLPVVYAGGSRAICQLEKWVHCNGIAPIGLLMLSLTLPKGAPLQAVTEGGALLPTDWISQPARTQDLGTAWRQAGSGLGLWVPSAVEPDERNLLLNPNHPAYRQIRIDVVRNPFFFDPRMFG